MIHSIEKIYQPGNRPINEDAYVIEEKSGIFSVIDGATGLGGLSGKTASNILKSALEQGTANETLSMLVLKGNQSLGEASCKEWSALSGQKRDQVTLPMIPKAQRSSCGLAAIKLFQQPETLLGKMKYIHAGDCMIFVEYHNGDVRGLTYDHIDKLDHHAIELMVKEWNNRLKDGENPNSWPSEQIKAAMEDIRLNILPLLQSNRNKLNTSIGYGIVDGSPEVEHFLEGGTINLIDVKQILLLSDGLKLHLKTSSSFGWEDTAKYAFKFGLSALLQKVLEMETGDPACYEYPRLKQHDDKTGILITLKDSSRSVAEFEK